MQESSIMTLAPEQARIMRQLVTQRINRLESHIAFLDGRMRLFDRDGDRLLLIEASFELTELEGILRQLPEEKEKRPNGGNRQSASGYPFG